MGDPWYYAGGWFFQRCEGGASVLKNTRFLSLTWLLTLLKLINLIRKKNTMIVNKVKKKTSNKKNYQLINLMTWLSRKNKRKKRFFFK